VFCAMPEQVLLSRVPGQPPLSRWIVMYLAPDAAAVAAMPGVLGAR
jgi:hypothetical protein